MSKNSDVLNKTWTLIPELDDESNMCNEEEKNNDEEEESNNNNDEEKRRLNVTANLPPKAPPKRSLTPTDLQNAARSISLFTISSDFEKDFNRFRNLDENMKSLFEESFNEIECQENCCIFSDNNNIAKNNTTIITKLAPSVSSSSLLSNNEEPLHLNGIEVIDGQKLSEIPFNTTPVPKTFDLFANDLKRNLDEFEDDHLASSSRSFKQTNNQQLTVLANNNKKEATNLVKFKTSLKILTSSIDKDLNKDFNLIKPPLPPTIVKDAETILRNEIETDEPRVVFNKTYTSWPMEDQQAQLEAFNYNDDESEINNRTINLHNPKKQSDNLNVTQDIIVQDLDDDQEMMDVDNDDDVNNNINKKKDLNITREILTSSSSSVISSVPSSLPSSKSSSLNNINHKQNTILKNNNNNNIERILNRTRSINEDSDCDINNVTIDKLSDHDANKRKSIFKKPVIDPIEPPKPSTQLSKLNHIYKNKPISNIAKPSLLQSKSLDSNKLPDLTNQKNLNNLMNTTTVIEPNDIDSNANTNAVLGKQTVSKLKYTSNIPAKQSKLPSPIKTNINNKSPVLSSNLPKFSQQQTLPRQLSVQQTSQKSSTDSKQSLVPSPNSNRLSSASSTSSSSSLKENKKISPPTIKSPNNSTTAKLKTIGLSNPNTIKTNMLNNINNQQNSSSKLKTIQLTSLPKPTLITNQVKTSSIPLPASSIPSSNILQQKPPSRPSGIPSFKGSRSIPTLVNKVNK